MKADLSLSVYLEVSEVLSAVAVYFVILIRSFSDGALNDCKDTFYFRDTAIRF